MRIWLRGNEFRTHQNCWQHSTHWKPNGIDERFCFEFSKRKTWCATNFVFVSMAERDEKWTAIVFETTIFDCDSAKLATPSSRANSRFLPSFAFSIELFAVAVSISSKRGAEVGERNQKLDASTRNQSQMMSKSIRNDCLESVRPVGIVNQSRLEIVSWNHQSG